MVMKLSNIISIEKESATATTMALLMTSSKTQYYFLDT